MSEDVHDSNNLPGISGCCAQCGFIFQLTFGFDCPRCRSTQLAWASKDYVRPDPGIPHVLNADGSACIAECDRCAVDKDVAELDKMFALEDNR